jgi:ubiquinone/menaquinone biosynthesis C-methylase UbiE
VVARAGWSARAQSTVDGLAERSFRRPFSSPEALFFETMIADSLCAAVLPALRPRVKGRRILDVGAGGGRLAATLAAGRSVVALDRSWSQVRRCRRRTQGGVPVIQADGEHLPFPDRTFDAVYSSCVFKHWPNPHLALGECARVTRSGGVVVTVEIDGGASASQFRRFAERTRIPAALRSGYVRFSMWTVVSVAPSADELVRAFGGMALQDLSVEPIPGLPFLVATALVS